MATIGDKNLTLADRIRRTDPNGAIAQIVESLTKNTAVLQDAVWKEGNLPDGHRFTSRNSLPPVIRRKFNQGVPSGKSGTAQVTETCTNLAARSEIDVQEAKLNGDEAAFRTSEDVAFVESISEQLDEALIYDSTEADPANMNGLLPRLDDTSGPAGKQIVKFGTGGTNTNASLLLVGWGDNTVHGIYPKGTKGGLSYDDMGIQYAQDANGNKFRAYCMDWSWMAGLCVKDKRFISAVRNIDMSTVQEGSAGSPVNDLIRAAVKALHKIYKPSAARLVWYAPRDLATFLHLQALSSVTHSTLTIEKVAGEPVTMLCGYPVRTADSMITTEAAIS